MTSLIERNLRRAMAATNTRFKAETLERVGRCVAHFIDAESRGDCDLHPESFIVELPIEDHEAARACFDMLELLRDIVN
jgi:hypothetical protein